MLLFSNYSLLTFLEAVSEPLVPSNNRMTFIFVFSALPSQTLLLKTPLPRSHATTHSPLKNASPTNIPRQNHSKLRRLDRIELPVIEIIMQRAVPASELQILEDLSIPHHLQRIEHIAALLLRRNDHILHQLLHAHRRIRVVIAVRRRERVVLPIPDHRRRDVEKREEIRHFPARLVYPNVTPHHLLAGEEEMRRLRLRELLVHRKPTEKPRILEYCWRYAPRSFTTAGMSAAVRGRMPGTVKA